MSEAYEEELKKQIDSVFEEIMAKLENSLFGKIYLKSLKSLSRIVLHEANRRRHYENFLEISKKVAKKIAPDLSKLKLNNLTLGESLSKMSPDTALMISDYIAEKTVNHCAGIMSVKDDYFIYGGKQAVRTIFYKDLK